MGSREWGMGSGEWGVGNGEWGVGKRVLSFNSFPAPHSPSSMNKVKLVFVRSLTVFWYNLMLVMTLAASI
jgi:hypothetical protein